VTGESQYFHATLPWDNHSHGRGWEGRGRHDANDPRIVWCTLYCTLPLDACDVDEACPFYWAKGHRGSTIPASVALERCKRLIEEAENALR